MYAFQSPSAKNASHNFLCIQNEIVSEFFWISWTCLTTNSSKCMQVQNMQIVDNCCCFASAQNGWKAKAQHLLVRGKRARFAREFCEILSMSVRSPNFGPALTSYKFMCYDQMVDCFQSEIEKAICRSSSLVPIGTKPSSKTEAKEKKKKCTTLSSRKCRSAD